MTPSVEILVYNGQRRDHKQLAGHVFVGCANSSAANTPASLCLFLYFPFSPIICFTSVRACAHISSRFCKDAHTYSHSHPCPHSHPHPHPLPHTHPPTATATPTRSGGLLSVCCTLCSHDIRGREPKAVDFWACSSVAICSDFVAAIACGYIGQRRVYIYVYIYIYI
jgi:hypothetical protein